MKTKEDSQQSKRQVFISIYVFRLGASIRACAQLKAKSGLCRVVQQARRALRQAGTIILIPCITDKKYIL